MKIVWRSKKFLIPTAVLMITVIGTAAAATLLFSHTFPTVTVPGVAPLVTTNCSGSLALGAAPTTASGVILFICPPTPPVLSSPLNTGSRTVAVSTTGSIPAGYTDLYAVPSTAPLSGTCAITAGSVAILSSNPGTGATLTVTASAGTGLAANSIYNYCADFSNTSTQPLVIPTFTVNWQQ